MRAVTTFRGVRGAVAAASPRAASAAVRVLTEGGSAVDAAVAAHLVLAVDSPHATGLGGDLLALVRDEGGTTACTGTGRAAADAPARPGSAGGTVTVPGFVAACGDLHAAGGRLPWDRLFDEAVEAARDGLRVDAALAGAIEAQRPRLEEHAPSLALLRLTSGDRWHQPELAQVLVELRDDGPAAWTRRAGTIAAAVRAAGGALSAADLIAHRTVVGRPVVVPFAGGSLAVQPPPSQGILLAMAAQWVGENAGQLDERSLDHLLVEATGAAFAHRDDAVLGEALLAEALAVDPVRAARRSGPRPYLHTAGVATVDADGQVVSSLSSVFDDFGSAVAVPELGVLLNDRGEGFTAGRNAFRPGARPVHTLAPALFERDGAVVGAATPGADGQVQTLLAVLARSLVLGTPLDEAIGSARWRSQSGALLVEASLPNARRAELAARGHDLVGRPDGADAFGAVVAAGFGPDGPWAVADGRRRTTGGAA